MRASQFPALIPFGDWRIERLLHVLSSVLSGKSETFSWSTGATTQAAPLAARSALRLPKKPP